MNFRSKCAVALLVGIVGLAMWRQVQTSERGPFTRPETTEERGPEERPGVPAGELERWMNQLEREFDKLKKNIYELNTQKNLVLDTIKYIGRTLKEPELAEELEKQAQQILEGQKKRSRKLPLRRKK